MVRNLLFAMGFALTLGWASSNPSYAMAPPPPPLSVSAEETALLSQGEVVIRYGGPGKETIAIVDVDAPPEKVMQAVIDLPPRKNEISSLIGLDIYLNQPGKLGARWLAGMGPIEITFNILYEYDLAKGWCTYTLDNSKENDLEYSRGSYQVYAIPSGTRLIYRATAGSSTPVPDWMRKRTAYTSAREMVGGMKKRAEAR